MLVHEASGQENAHVRPGQLDLPECGTDVGELSQDCSLGCWVERLLVAPDPWIPGLSLVGLQIWQSLQEINVCLSSSSLSFNLIKGAIHGACRVETTESY